MSNIQLQQEILNDPAGLGYARMTDGQAARALMANNRAELVGLNPVTLRDVRRARHGIVDYASVQPQQQLGGTRIEINVQQPEQLRSPESSNDPVGPDPSPMRAFEELGSERGRDGSEPLSVPAAGDSKKNEKQNPDCRPLMNRL
jgi:hypothetical protein